MMTNERAKKIIFNQWQAFLDNYIDYGGVSEAYKLAIKALEQEPCDDCISRDAVEDAIAEEIVNGESLGYAVAYDILSDLPSVTPQPKVGKWIKNEEYDGYATTLTDCCCSVCGKKALFEKSYSMDGQSIVLCPSNYCPSCGAKMEVE